MTRAHSPGSGIPATITVPVGRNGPAGSANGGVAAGLLGSLIDGAARVRLMAPPPLATAMDVVPADGGLEARLGGDVVMAAVPATFELDPPAVTRAEAEQAAAPFIGHTAVTCFVCGPDSPRGLQLFPGPVGDGSTHATVWTPEPWAGDGDGVVTSDVVWGALDCPGAIALARVYDDHRFFPALGTMTAQLFAPVRVGETYTVVAWPKGRDGRKLFAGTYLADPSGAIVGASDQVCIAMPAEWGSAR